MNTEILKEIGLTNTEIKVYIALLESGESLASKISEKARVERAVTYHILEKLIRKGIASYVIKENRKYFSAAEPERLKSLLREKEDLLNDIIPELIKLKKPAEERVIVEVFRGEEGLKTILEDLLKYKTPYFTIGYTGKSAEIAKFWFIHWNKRRVKNKIKRFVLIRKGDEKLEALKYPLTDMRIMPKEAIHESKTSIIIYGGNRVVLFLPLEEFVAVRIVNKEVHNSYKDYFDILWKKSRKIQKSI